MNKLLVLALTFLSLSALEPFISPSELKHSLSNDNLIIIDVASIALYNKSHIQNALHLDVEKLTNKQDSYIKIKHSSILDEITKLGINSNSNIVIYSHNTDKSVLNSSFLALVLIANGFENVSILDGGYMAWVFENELLTSSSITSLTKDGNYTISYNPNILVNSDYVEKNIYKVKILDSRSPEEYFGTSRSKNIQRVGHIKSASSSYYQDNFLTDGTLRNKDELVSIYIDGHEIKQNDEVIVYGRDIYEASMNWFILYKYMNFKNTKVYENSLIEWENNPQLPMIKFKWE